MSVILKTRDLGLGISAQAIYREGDLRVEVTCPGPEGFGILKWFPESEEEALKLIEGFKRLTRANLRSSFEDLVRSAQELTSYTKVVSYKVEKVKTRSR